MAYGRYKDLVKRTESDKVLRDKAFKITSNPKYNGYQRGVASMVYTFFNKKSKGSDIKSMSYQQFADNSISQLLENIKDARSILHLKTIFGELILLICI